MRMEPSRTLLVAIYLSVSCADGQTKSQSRATAQLQQTAPSQTETQSPMPVSEAVNAANAFLATLSPQQKSAVLYAFNDDNQRANWSNFPTGIVQRGGLLVQTHTPFWRQPQRR